MLKYYLLIALFISSITAQNWAGTYTAVLLDDTIGCPPGNSSITITQNGATISLTITNPNSPYDCNNGHWDLTVASSVIALDTSNQNPAFAVYFTNNNTILWNFNDGATQWLLSNPSTINTIGQNLDNWMGNWTVGSSDINPSCGNITSLSVQSSNSGSPGYVDVLICSDVICSGNSEYADGGAFYDPNDLNYIFSVITAENLAMMNPNGTITWIGGFLGIGMPQVQCEFLFVKNGENGGAILKLVSAFYVILQIIIFIY